MSSFFSNPKLLEDTCEKEKNSKIPFLDLELHRTEKKVVSTNWYRKPTFSGRYLKIFSHNPIAKKKAIIYNLVDKCILLSDPQYHSKNLNLIKHLLINNSYPVEYLKNISIIEKKN